MKLLFDQNISYRLIKKINDVYEQAYSLRALGLSNSSDIDLWRYAKDNDFTIVTFDADFFDFTTLYGAPPKIIWIKTGNMTTENLANLLLERETLIRDFIKREESDILLLSFD